MNTTRSVRPTDLVALVSLDGRVFLNQARTWERLGLRSDQPRLVESGLGSWISFASGRRTWVNVEGLTIRGLVSARHRVGRSTWEIDRLITASGDTCATRELLERISSAASRAGVARIFLRLTAESELAGAARRSGFAPYLEEKLLRADGDIGGSPFAAGLTADPYQPADAFSVYRLYNASAPDGVRRVEAPTFQQWLGAEEYRNCGRTQCDYVIRRDDEAVARLRAFRSGGQVRLAIHLHPAAEDVVPGILEMAAKFAERRRPLYCLVPAYAGGLEHALTQGGFELDSQYAVFMKRTALPIAVAKPGRAPVPVANPIAAV